MDTQQWLSIKTSILHDYGFYLDPKINKWINHSKGKVLHGDWIKVVDTSILITTIKEVLGGNCPDMKRLKDILTDLQSDAVGMDVAKFVEVDRLLHQFLGEKWINN